MPIDRIMTRHVVTATMDTTIQQIQHIFARYKFHHVIITEHGKAVGVISDRDLLKAISPFIGKMAERTQDIKSLDRKAHQVMVRQIITATPDTPIADASRLMLNNNISCLPILDDENRCIGIVTWRDMLRWATSLPCAKNTNPDTPQQNAA